MEIMKFLTVEDEFKKNKDLNKDDLEMLKEWAEKQPHLPKTSDLDLIIFLHSCHWSVEFTKQTIDNYYTIRTHFPEAFSHRDTQHYTLQNAMAIYNFCIIPCGGVKKEMLFCTKMRKQETDTFNYIHGVKYFMHITDLMFKQHGTVDGFSLIMDMTAVKPSWLTKIGLMNMKKVLTYLQEAFQVRISGIHFTHPLPILDKMINLCKPFMKPELCSVLHVHTNLDSLFQFANREKLPKDFGGYGKTMEEMADDSRKNVIAHTQFFIDEENLRVDEKKRPGKAKNAECLFGAVGSFKKLDID